MTWFRRCYGSALPPRDRTKRRVTPRQSRARASVDAILEATEQLLRDEGFARTTTNRIAARAGVNVSLVYRYFAGKEAIVGALVERTAEATFVAVRDALTEHASSPVEVALRAMLVALVDTPGLHPEVHRQLVEHVDLTRRRDVIHDLRARAGRVFRAFLRQRAREVGTLADREATVFVLEHVVESGAHASAFYRPKGISKDRALEALLQVLLRALGMSR
jgi:AcrR family transcriptional regulator